MLDFITIDLDLGLTNSVLLVVVFVLLLVCAYYLRTPPAPPKPVIVKPSVSKTRAIKKAAQVPDNTKGKIKIFFGSQTGTADDFSHTLEKEARQHAIYAEVVDLENYENTNFENESLCVFVMATHGEGEPTDNAKQFWQWLEDKNQELHSSSLTKMAFTVFGLGNKTYEHYNAVARVVDKRLEELGAKRIYERGEGDDDCSLEEDFNRWKKRLWASVCAELNIPYTDSIEDEKFVPRFKILSLAESKPHKNSRGFGVKTKEGKHDIKNPYMARVLVNRELHGKTSDRSCRHIELDIGNAVTYEPGDHLGVYPENEATLVQHLIEHLGLDGDMVCALVPIDTKKTDGSDAVIGPCTVRQALTDATDITTPPRKAVLRALAGFATNPEEKKKLTHLSSEQGNDEYNNYVKNDNRTIYEILVDFPSSKPQLSDLLELLPRLAPRYYSISSSSNAHPGRVHITSVLVNFVTNTKRRHNGVCTTWLSSLKPGDLIPVFSRASHFHIPKQPVPLVMIGPGTGLAPFRGFLQELAHRNKLDGDKWKSVLFFGCRERDKDFIYEDELLAHSRSGTLEQLHLAFSRETSEKVYVQHKMLQNKELIWDQIHNKKGYFYVCGDARQMAKSVNQALHTIAVECGKMNDAEATAYLEQLQKSGRYLQDVWF